MENNLDQNIQSSIPPQGEPENGVPGMVYGVPGPMNGVPDRAYGAQGRRRMTWRERLFLGNTGRPLTAKQELTMPDWAVGKSVAVFFIAFAACTLAFGYPMELRDAVISSLSVLVFFYGCKNMLANWVRDKEKAFIKNIFIFGLLARLLWAMYCYFFFNPEYHGNTYGEAADVEWYMPFGEAIAEWLRGDTSMSFGELMVRWQSQIDDMGYPFWLAIINLLTFGESDVFVPFLLKCLASAYCSVCIYHIAKRHFGNGTARLAALFVALNPNMIYWCGNMFKESEMVFLCCLCVNLVDKTFTSGNKLTFRSLLPGVLAGMAVFFFRAPLAIVLFLAMGAHIVMASNRVMSAGKKIIAGFLVGVVLLVGMGDRLRTQAESIVDTVQSDQQKINMEWRSTRKDGGNEFAKYAGKVVFAPLIFTIPFPSFNVALESQVLQRQLSGGSYIKNVFSFFVIWMMIFFLISGEWRKHVFILAYTLGYLASLTLSSFAQSGRFHMPIWPFLMLFAAYGIQVAKTNPRMRRWFLVALVVEVMICLAWNWFKLKGRGMI